MNDGFFGFFLIVFGLCAIGVSVSVLPNTVLLVPGIMGAVIGFYKMIGALGD